jgi:penicillin amidase
MRRVFRYGFWSLCTLVSLLAVLVVGGVFWLRTSLPELDGETTLAGLNSNVTALRDNDGIVTIKADSDLDAYRALGYLHAQDRLWQMDFMRRAGAGRLSEVVGSATLRIDRLMRTLGFYQLAAASYPKLSPEVRSALDAYSAGVNAYMETAKGAWPLEFYLLRYTPEPWTPADSLVWGRLMALQLSGNWRSELLRARLGSFLKPAQIRDLWPDYPTDAPVALTDLERKATLDPLESLPWSLTPKHASNSWVLSGSRTTTGKPILANDPHLALDAPGLWYLVDIQTPSGRLRGASAPGVPFVVLGQNDNVAWGYTSTEGDTQDLFVEKLDPENPERYQTPQGFTAFDTRDEIIRIRGEEDVVLTVRNSRHGPIVDELSSAEDLTGSAATAGTKDDTAIALAWTALRDDDLIPQAIYGFNRARNWPEFLAASRYFHAPQQSVIYADRSGDIGLIVPGRVPVRAKGDGRVPAPGWNDDYAWTGLIPFEELPRGVNPASGYLIAANNRIVDKTFPHLIAADWSNQYRAARAREQIDATPKGSIEDSTALQTDILSLPARQIMPILLNTNTDHQQSVEALRMLSTWDFRMERNRPEPLIYNVWLDKLNAALLEDELGSEFASFRKPKTELLVRILSGESAEGSALDWCDRIDRDGPQTCNDMLASSLIEALAELETEFGSGMGEWRWGDVHRATLPHPILSRIPVLDRLFDIGVETDGGSETLMRASMSFNGPLTTRFNDRHGAGYRAVYDLADPDNSRFMISTGQSANPFSEFYGSLTERWRDGRYITIDGKKTNAVHRLVMMPSEQ